MIIDHKGRNGLVIPLRKKFGRFDGGHLEKYVNCSDSILAAQAIPASVSGYSCGN
jgi:hypothetical protein